MILNRTLTKQLRYLKQAMPVLVRIIIRNNSGLSLKQYTSKQKEQGCGKIYHSLNSWLKVLKQTLWDNFHYIWFKYIRITLWFVFACIDKQFKERLWLYSIVANSSDRTFPNENWTGKQLSPLCLNQDGKNTAF